MKKESITICVDNSITQEELQRIRARFKEQGHAEKYRLNIMISGNNNAVDTLSSLLLSEVK